MEISSLGQTWLFNVRGDLLAGLVVALVKDHGLQYLLAASVLTGVLQIIAGLLKLGSLMRFVSRSVITGFVNALACLIFLAQLPELTNVSWVVYAMTAAGLAIIYGLPYPTKGIPSPLVTIVVLTIVAVTLDLDIRTVGDMGQLPDSLPVFLAPDVPLTLDTLKIILPYSATLAVVGLLESISTLAAGIFLLILIVFLGPWVKLIPMAALVAVMIMVSSGTFSWESIRKLREHPPSSSIVMIATVIVTVSTHDLAKGVFVGVLLSGLFFAHKVGHVLRIDRSGDEAGGVRGYNVVGQVFFASAETFIVAFDFKEVVEKVRIDLSHAHFWDITAVSALDKVVLKFRREGTAVEVIGLNEASAVEQPMH